MDTKMKLPKLCVDIDLYGRAFICGNDEDVAPEQAHEALARCNAAPKLVEALKSWLEGCGDGGCRIKTPVGMHTNGGCRCLRPRDFIDRIQAILKETGAEK